MQNLPGRNKKKGFSPFFCNACKVANLDPSNPIDGRHNHGKDDNNRGNRIGL
ncbi:hypothetical protein REIFOR_01686 [Reinekea forsetii]|uniref:Uncharacterized protein n=1 Tax=Reinekea forsetii TaxID=1336806 RepID=A0A2K8KQ00_9GAMM|nr:hypothetical protein REIFOR_01686 [Reinekea forsetii]